MKNPHIKEIDANKLLFHFALEKNKENILSISPWNIIGYPLILREWPPDAMLNELDFSTIQFWEQIHGLLREKMTLENATHFGSCMGTTIEVDGSMDPLEMYSKSDFRVKVEISLDKPLKP